MEVGDGVAAGTEGSLAAFGGWSLSFPTWLARTFLALTSCS